MKGSSIAAQTTISSVDSDYTFTSSSDLYYGTAVAPAGDVDGDGRADGGLAGRVEAEVEEVEFAVPLTIGRREN